MPNLSAKHIVVALLAAATVLVAPLAFPHESHLLIDLPAVAEQG